MCRYVILTKLVSVLYFDPRPFVIDHSIPLISHVADNGFPSDHTVLAATTALLVLRYKQLLGSILLALACWIGISRILAHVHRPIDVFGALVIAVMSVLLAFVLASRIKAHLSL